MVRYAFALILILGSIFWPHQSQPEGLDVLLSAEKATYFTYEPIVLNMAVTNKGREPIKGEFDCFSFGCKDLTLLYKKRGAGEFKRYYNATIWAASIKHILRLGEKPTLPPGGQVSAQGIVLLDHMPIPAQEERFVFSEPGEYEFKVTFQYILEDPSRVVESNDLRVTVADPPEEVRAALASWKDKDLALVVQGDGLSVEGIDKLRTFLQKFPGSPYASFARAAHERWLGYFTEQAKKGKLTERQKTLYEYLRLRD